MRSSHRKSRNGCRECKQRHKKCDESSPTCLNCSITNRSCSYRHTRPSYRLCGPKTTAPPFTPSLSAVLPLTQCRTQEWQAQGYSLRHLELLHHFESRGFEDASMLLLPVSTRKMIMQCALTSPYLMDQILALSASHISTIRQEEQQAFSNRAMELQTRALTIFNKSELGISKQNSRSWFFYASFLGLQVMFETFQCNNFDSFLDQLATYFPVHQGVQAVIQKSWPTIKDIVEEIVGQRDLSDAEGVVNGRHQECDDIASLIDECDLEETDRDACLKAVEVLQRIFELHRANPRAPFQIQFTIAWPILVPARFGDMLRRRIPEALIILSFYAVLLHRLHYFWVFGNSGSFLIQSISAYLGTPWSRWLVWPNEQLRQEHILSGTR